MRGVIWEIMTLVHGSFTPQTQKEWVKQSKRLEAIWRKSPEDFSRKIDVIKASKEVSNG